MGKPNLSRIRRIFGAAGMLILLIPFLTNCASSPAKTSAADPSGTAEAVPSQTEAAVSEDVARVIAKYKGEDPDYEGWNRVSSRTDPVRYERSGDTYVYTAPTTSGKARIMCAGDLICEPGLSRSVFHNDKFFFESCFKFNLIFLAFPREFSRTYFRAKSILCGH